MSVHKCSDEFKKFLTGCSIRELINLVRDFDRTLPEDAEYLEATKAELKRQASKAMAKAVK